MSLGCFGLGSLRNFLGQTFENCEWAANSTSQQECRNLEENRRIEVAGCSGRFPELDRNGGMSRQHTMTQDRGAIAPPARSHERRGARLPTAASLFVDSWV